MSREKAHVADIFLILKKFDHVNRESCTTADAHPYNTPLSNEVTASVTHFAIKRLFLAKFSY
jgi:hypothetical protein